MPTTSPTIFIPTSRTRGSGSTRRRSPSPPARPRRPRPARSPTWPPRRCCYRSRPCSGARRSRSRPTFKTWGSGAVARVHGVLRPDRAGRLAHRRHLPGRDDDPGPCLRCQPTDQPDLQLPTRLPAGVTLGSVGYARIEVITNPENIFNESHLYQRRFTVRSRSSCDCPATRPPCRPLRPPARSPRFQQLALRSPRTRPKGRRRRTAKLAAKVAARNATKPAEETPPQSGQGRPEHRQGRRERRQGNHQAPHSGLRRDSSGRSDLSQFARRCETDSQIPYTAQRRTLRRSPMLRFESIPSSFRGTRNPHNPSIFRRFVGLSDTIAENLSQN